MPIKNPQQQANKPTAATVEENKPFRERLRDRYAPTDYVRVINIDNEAFEWQYFPIDGEETNFTDNGTVRVISGRQSFSSNFRQRIPGNEQVWELGPGESEVLLGANADLFIEGLYKKLVAKQRIKELPNMEKHQARSFNWNDGLLQEQMINEIFLGIERPRFDEPKAAPSPTGKTVKGA